MSKKSKVYGKGFEYEVRDILREATGDNSFERVPSSGAYFGGSNKIRAETARKDLVEIMSGDLICPPGWRWIVECKNHEDVPVHQLFLGKNSKTIDEFLKQVSEDADTSNKEPLLVMKLRRKGYTLSKKVRDQITAAGVKPPSSNSSTIGIMVAERADYCFDIMGNNHIQYTGKLNEKYSATWCFFDINVWLDYIEERQYKILT